MIQEHERIVLTGDLPDDRLKAGDVGTVVHIYPNAAAYEVEFFTLVWTHGGGGRFAGAARAPDGNLTARPLVTA